MVVEEGSWLSDDGKQVQTGITNVASGVGVIAAEPSRP